MMSWLAAEWAARTGIGRRFRDWLILVLVLAALAWLFAGMIMV